MSCDSDRGAAGRARTGFTLLELIVVVAIIAALAAVVAPSMFSNVGDAKHASARSQVDALQLSLNQYRLDNDEFPTSAQGLEALRRPPQAANARGELPANWRGPYVQREVPMDPWRRPYLYISPGRVNPHAFDLYTLGRDGRVGGEGEDADVTSWGGPVDEEPLSTSPGGGEPDNVSLTGGA